MTKRTLTSVCFVIVFIGLLAVGAWYGRVLDDVNCHGVGIAQNGTAEYHLPSLARSPGGFVIRRFALRVVISL